MPVEIARRGAGKKFPSRKLEKIADAILKLVGRDQAELSLALIGNSEMRRLNARYRHKDYPTDVLSFPIEGTVAGRAAYSAMSFFRSRRHGNRQRSGATLWIWKWRRF